MRQKIYPDNASRQKAYEDRKKQKEELEKSKLINWDASLQPFLTYFQRMNNLEEIPDFQKVICNNMSDLKISNLICCSGRGIGKSQISSTYALYLADEFSRYLKKPLDVTLISSQPTIYTHIDRISALMYSVKRLSFLASRSLL